MCLYVCVCVCVLHACVAQSLVNFFVCAISAQPQSRSAAVAACRCLHGMADSKISKLSGNGLMVAAMVYRVKYRKVNHEGKPIKLLLSIESMGVHKNKRGGVYPAGIRCKSLCVTVLEAGFIKEDVSHALIVVEEPPFEEIIKRGIAAGHKVISASTYNAQNCTQDELLSTCFETPYDDVRYTLLSHNHIMLVLRAFLTKATWDLPANEEKHIIFCDAADFVYPQSRRVRMERNWES